MHALPTKFTLFVGYFEGGGEYIQVVNIWINSLGCLTEIQTEREISAEAFRQLVKERKDRLKEGGLGRDNCIAIEMNSSIDSLVTLFAVWSVGDIAALLAPNLPKREKDHLLGECEADYFWTLEGELEKLSEERKPSAERSRDFMGPGTILFTSGSHSLGKACFHSLNRLNARIETLKGQFSNPEMSHTLCFLPLNFGHGLIGNCLLPLMSGQHLILNPLIETMVPSKFRKIVNDFGITFVSATPSIWRILLKANSERGWGSSIQRIHCASEPFFPAIYVAMREVFVNAKIFNVYGLTELGSWVSGACISEFGLDGSNHCENVGSGWGSEAILNKHGEIMLRSSGIMDFCKVANKWVGFSESDWFNTGDIGSISCDGTLSVLGRSKNIVNRGGSKISIEGLEMVFLEHPKIREICVFAKRDHAVGEEVYAAFVGDVSESELRN